jgi:hypothetical protein
MSSKSRKKARCDEQSQAIQQLQARWRSGSLKDLAFKVVNLTIVKRPGDINHLDLPQELQQELRICWGELETPSKKMSIK